jgi:hypothetical protein
MTFDVLSDEQREIRDLVRTLACDRIALRMAGCLGCDSYDSTSRILRRRQ